MDKLRKNVKSIVGPLCKAIYYLFIIWMIVVSTAGTYKVIVENKGSHKDSAEYRLGEVKRIELLEQEVYELYSRLGYKYGVNLYYVEQETAYHSERVTILAHAGSRTGNRDREYWQEEETYSGYKKLNERVRQEGVIYIPDISKDTLIFKGRAKEDLVRHNVKSIYCFVIDREEGSQTYILTLSSEGDIEIASVDFYLDTRQAAKNIRTIIRNDIW